MPDVPPRFELIAGSRVREALQRATAVLAGEDARREAEVLLTATLGVGRAWLFAHADDSLGHAHAALFAEHVNRRISGEPIAYVLGEREFYGLSLQVSPATLIPRADTETLVELALARLPRRAGLRVLDLGTGSGAIALALAHLRPELEVIASDASAAALAVAAANAKALGLQRVSLVMGDWFEPFAGRRFDMVLSNPPYIEDADAHLDQGDLRFEPRSALASGADGFDDLRRIVAASPAHLNSGGWLLCEHGWRQGKGMRDLLRAAGFAEVATWVDLEGRDRISGGQWLTL
jgi:release factor glutamine methyltransferase